MAKKGESPHLKRIAASTYSPVLRKSSEWLMKPGCGVHPACHSVALVVLIRDILNLADNSKEVKAIMKNGDILIDGKIRKVDNFAVGMMDVVSIPKMKKYYRMIIDSKERAKLLEIKEEESKYKLCKVKSKTTAKKGKLQIGTHDGRLFPLTQKADIGDVLKVSIPEEKVIGVYRLEKGARCIIEKGKHAGKIVVVEELTPSTQMRKSEAKLKSENGDIITVKDYLFVIGDALQ
ncbi:MAG: 30S ribosomal protein S4e [Candidatus Micrarchaeota archaeon]